MLAQFLNNCLLLFSTAPAFEEGVQRSIFFPDILAGLILEGLGYELTVFAVVLDSFGNHAYFHIVNHMPGVERMSVVSLKFPVAVRARILSPDDPKIRYVRESHLVLKIGVYTVVEVKEGL